MREFVCIFDIIYLTFVCVCHFSTHSQTGIHTLSHTCSGIIENKSTNVDLFIAGVCVRLSMCVCVCVCMRIDKKTLKVLANP